MTDSLEIKFCVNCKNYRRSNWWMIHFIPIIGNVIYFIERENSSPKCHYGENLSLVTGKYDGGTRTNCAYMRQYNCGKEAKYFVPKKRPLAKISDKTIMDEVLERGLLEVMKGYKKGS